MTFLLALGYWAAAFCLTGAFVLAAWGFIDSLCRWKTYVY